MIRGRKCGLLTANGKRVEMLVSTQDKMSGSLMLKFNTACSSSMLWSMGNCCKSRETENINQHSQTNVFLFCFPPLTSSSRHLRMDATVHSMRNVIASQWTADGDSMEQKPSAVLASKVQRENGVYKMLLHIQVLDVCCCTYTWHCQCQ